jgi:hypothetical protein
MVNARDSTYLLGAVVDVVHPDADDSEAGAGGVGEHVKVNKCSVSMREIMWCSTRRMVLTSPGQQLGRAMSPCALGLPELWPPRCN